MTFDLWVLPTFSHVVTSDLWTLNFPKCWPSPNKFFWFRKVATWYIWMDTWLQNCIFPIFVMWWPWTFTCVPQISQMLNSDPTKIFGLKKISSRTFKCYSFKLHICPYLVIKWLWYLTTEPQFSRKTKHCPIVFSIDKSCHLVHLNAVIVPKM